LIPPKLAVIVTDLVAVTSLCVTLKLIVSAPLRIFTLAGTVTTLVFELVNVTVSPVVGASPVSSTVPDTGVFEPPTTDVGDSVRLSRVEGRTVRVAVWLVPL
jgi:hypothetical protein